MNSCLDFLLHKTFRIFVKSITVCCYFLRKQREEHDYANRFQKTACYGSSHYMKKIMKQLADSEGLFVWKKRKDNDTMKEGSLSS